MSANPSEIPDHWLELFSRESLIREFGERTVQRATSYARNNVGNVRIREGFVNASVQGSRSYPYEVLLDPRPPVGGFCTCPVGEDCKHVVALALHLVMGVEAKPVDSWEEQLARLLPAEVSDDHPPLGLQFELGTVPGDPRQHLLLRPVRPGKSRGWVRTEVSWDRLQYGHYSSYANHPARPGLLALREAAGAASYWTNAAVDLNELGPRAWALLERVVDAGVSLVYGKNGVATIEPAASAHLDVSRVGASADAPIEVQARFAVTGDGTPDLPLSPNPLLFGSPVFALGAVSAGQLHLWPLDPAPDQTLSAMITAPPIRVPADDLPRFRKWFVPRLRKIAPVESADNSVDLPAPAVPELVARVSHQPNHVTELDLHYRYRPDGEDGPPVDIPLTGPVLTDDDTDPGDLDQMRDLRAERELLTGPLSDHLFFGGPRSHHRFTDGDTVRFVTQVLPELSAAATVESDGTPLDYVHAVEGPVVEYEVEDGPADWFDLGISVTVDGHQVPLIPLIRKLAADDHRLILDSGLVVDLRRPEFAQMRETLAIARAISDPVAGPVRMRPEHLGLWEELLAKGVVRRQSARWRELAETALTEVSADGAEATLPSGLAVKLRPYQVAGFGWLDRLWQCGLGGILADDMGLGKTVQALAAIMAAQQRAEDSGRPSKPVLVVAPTSVVSNWVDEAARFTPGLRVRGVTATARKRGMPLDEIAGEADVIVTTYALLRLEVEDYTAISWSAVLLDEAQQVKNRRAKGYQAVRRLQSDVRFVITGTPMENNLMELWTMLSIAAPGLFPDPDAFAADYRQPIEKGNPEVLSTLRRRIRPLMLRRTKELVATDLPAKQEQTFKVELGSKHRKMYDTQLARERQRVLGLLDDLDAHRIEVLRALTALRQLALAPELVNDPDLAVLGSEPTTTPASTPPAKVEQLVELARELAAEGHRALVFSQFTRFLDLIGGHLTKAGIGHTRLDGTMSTRQREAAIEEFRGEVHPLFLISLKAGGFGLNLTEADYVFVMDPWWNPAAEQQAVDRTHRIGQTRPVHVFRMIAADTIEEKVARLQERKRELFAQVINAEAGMADTRLTADDLRELFG